jgi:hypothetical protein
LSVSDRKERGEHRSIYVSIVDDYDFLPLHRHSKLIWYTLKMSLGLSGIGVMGMGKLADLTGIPYPEIDAALVELEVTQWIKRDHHVIWIRNGLRCDPYFNPHNRNHVLSVMRHLAGLPKSKLIPEFCGYYDFDPAWVGGKGIPADWGENDQSISDTPPEVSEIRREGEKERGDKEITAGKTKRGAWRFCPDEWTPNEKHYALADELRVDLPVELAKFRDHEFKTPKTDADRAFSRWLRQAKAYGNVLGVVPRNVDASTKLRSQIEQTAEYLRRTGIAS